MDVNIGHPYSPHKRIIRCQNCVRIDIYATSLLLRCSKCWVFLRIKFANFSWKVSARQLVMYRCSYSRNVWSRMVNLHSRMRVVAWPGWLGHNDAACCRLRRKLLFEYVSLCCSDCCSMSCLVPPFTPMCSVFPHRIFFLNVCFRAINMLYIGNVLLIKRYYQCGDFLFGQKRLCILDKVSHFFSSHFSRPAARWLVPTRVGITALGGQLASCISASVIILGAIQIICVSDKFHTYCITFWFRTSRLINCCFAFILEYNMFYNLFEPRTI